MQYEFWNFWVEYFFYYNADVIRRLIIPLLL